MWDRISWLRSTVAWRCILQSPWVALLGVALIVRGQWLWLQDIVAFWPGGWYALAGIALIALSFRLQAFMLRPPERSISPTNNPSYRVSWRVAVAVVGIGVCIYTSVHAIQEQNTVWELYAMWLAGLSLTVFGLVPRDDAAAWWGAARRSLRQEWRAWLLLGLLFVIALVLRTAWLDSSPYIMAGDEAAFSIQAVAIKDKLHWQVNPFKYGVWHHPWVYHTLMGVAIDVFGQTAGAARVPSAVLGALTVPAVHLMGRSMFDRRVGWVAAIFMAAYPLHVHFSRTAINQVGDPLFAALTFAFLVRVLRRGNTMDAALAGLAMGLSQYFYSAARIVPLLMAGFVGFYLLTDWRRVWRHRMGIAITFGVALLVAFPNLYAVYEDDERPISPRLDQVSIWETGNVTAAAEKGRLKEYWFTQIHRSFMVYVQVPDESGFYSAYNPVLGWYAGIPFVVGLGIIVRRWRDPCCTVLAAWVVATAILGGMLLVDPPHFPRYISVTPGLAVIVALGVVWFGVTVADILAGVRRWLPRLDGDLERRLRWGIPLLLVMVLALADQRTYIVDYLPQKLVYGEPTVQLNEVVSILDTLEGQYTVWYFSSLYLDMSGSDLLPYLTPENDGEEYRGEIAKWYEVIDPGPTAFVIVPGRYDEVIGELRMVLPGGELREYTNPRTSKPLVYLYLVNVRG
jgi:4-amino-4-deoxy-L-arabinose transferase-like glycosyltransferase